MKVFVVFILGSNPDPVGSAIIWLHGSGSVIGWFPGYRTEVIN